MAFFKKKKTSLFPTCFIWADPGANVQTLTAHGQGPWQRPHQPATVLCWLRPGLLSFPDSLPSSACPPPPPTGPVEGRKAPRTPSFLEFLGVLRKLPEEGGSSKCWQKDGPLKKQTHLSLNSSSRSCPCSSLAGLPHLSAPFCIRLFIRL